MKTIFTLFFILISYITESQISGNSEWNWLNGDSSKNSVGIYGTKGTADVLNKPGARISPVTWTDTSGICWLFGGYGFATGVKGYLNDVWKYEPLNNQWTWVWGDTAINKFGVYGSLRVAATSNKPGARSESASCLDASGNLWVFGGNGQDEYIADARLNDLWKYNPGTNQWTWINGDKTRYVAGVYGTQGVAAAANKPGARSDANLWMDSNGSLWLFGGYGNTNDGAGTLNDLWKYNPNTNLWTWMTGFNSITGSNSYGIQGIPSPLNTPGQRSGANSWQDTAGKFWIFGGFGKATNFIGNLNDIWKYDPITNQWTWIKGDKTPRKDGVYGELGVSDVNNNPGARENATSWKDESGNFWLFGGLGEPASGNYGILNDLWKFNPAINDWVWIKGDSIRNLPGEYGTRGIATAANKPGSRYLCNSWLGKDGSFWLFGGMENEGSFNTCLNDLWKLSNINSTSQTTDYYRTISDGNWNQPTSWESSAVPDFSSGVVTPATLTPDQSADVIIVRNTHTINVTVNVIVDQLIQQPGSSILVKSGVNFIIK